MSRFEGRVVWVTGASSGIGEAIARAFAQEGATVVVTARREEKLRALADACPDPSRVHPIVADFEHPEQIEAAYAAALEKVGHIDILVNNAGLTQWSKAAETSMDVVRRIMEVNFFATVDLTNRVLQDMLPRKSGHVVVMSSINGHIGTPKSSTYAASKHALQGYFEALRAEMSKKGIAVTMICPGFVDTGIGARSLKADGSEFGEAAKGPAKAISAEALARTTLDAVAKKRREVVTGGSEVAGVYLKRLAPGLLAKLLARQVRS